MSEESSLGVLLLAAQKQREVIEALRPLAKIGSEFEDLLTQAHACFNAIVVKILEQHLDKVSLSLDPKKGSWENQHAILQVGHGSFQIRIPAREVKARHWEIWMKVRVKMSDLSGFRKAQERRARVERRERQLAASGGVSVANFRFSGYRLQALLEELGDDTSRFPQIEEGGWSVLFPYIKNFGFVSWKMQGDIQLYWIASGSLMGLDVPIWAVEAAKTEWKRRYPNGIKPEEVKGWAMSMQALVDG